jgi:hypothetical protein
MSLFVNCGWRPPAGTKIQTRIGQIVRLLERDETVALVGRNWYRLGRSKREALSKPLSLTKLTEVRSWGRGKVIIEETGREERDYSLGVWNGRDEPDIASLSVMLHEPSTWSDSLVFRGPGLESVKDKWRSVLAWGEAIATHLGGQSEVSSHDLRDWAGAEGMKHADSAAYAVFEGDGRSSVAATTWSEVIAPDKKRVQEVIRMIRASIPK